MSIETLERTNGLLATDDLIYAARQSGLHRLTADGDNSRSLFESWLPGQDVPTLAIAAYGELLMAGIKGGVARSADGGRQLGGAAVSGAGPARDLPGAFDRFR